MTLVRSRGQPRLSRIDCSLNHRTSALPAHDERPRHLSSQQSRDPLVMTDASPSPIKMAPIKMAPIKMAARDVSVFYGAKQALNQVSIDEIGRASCRERGCQYE